MAAKKQQHVWLVRYGLTEHKLVEGVGPYDSDIDPTVGMEHANAIAARIASSGAAAPDMVYSDPFHRTTHTADVIVKAIIKGSEKADDAKIHRIEEGVTEWLVPSLLVDPNGKKTDPRTTAQLVEMFPANIDPDYKAANPVVPDDTPRDDAPPGAPLFVETEKDLFVRCATSVAKILDLHQEGSENLCIVSHAPCNQAMALALEGKTDPKDSKFGTWSLGGLTLFSRSVSTEGEKYGQWKCEFYSSTDHMPGEYKEGTTGAWSLPSFMRSDS